MEVSFRGIAAGTALWGNTGECNTETSGAGLLGALDCTEGDPLPTGMSAEVPTFLLGTAMLGGVVGRGFREKLGYGPLTP